jgi:hypothetical protein
MGMSFFGMLLAQTWLARTQNITLTMPYSLRTRNVIINVATGQALDILDICPENRDESNGNSVVKLWLQFIPIFGALHSQLRKGHTKKRHLHVPHIHRFSAKGHERKKDISILSKRFLSPITLKLSARVIC